MIRSVGLINIAAGGTPVQVSTGRTNLLGKGIQFQAAPGNAGIVYIGVAGMNKSTGVGVLAVLPKPADATTGPFASQSFSEPYAPAALSAGDFWIDGTTSDKVYVSMVGRQ